MKTFGVLHLFCGLGGGAVGFGRARARFGGLDGRFVTLGGVDNDPAACADFETLSGVPAYCADVAAMTPAQLLEATGGVAPDVVFTSPPCKGFSGLLGSKRVGEEKYQRLNALVFQGLWLVLETWPDHPPKLIVLENVPRIATRGAELLRKLCDLLHSYGYATNRDFHDCGEIGGLGQHRRRFLLMARHRAQVPAFVYRPPKRRVRSIGEVLGELPMPDDPRGGAMHRLPRLEWRTWVRLALIPAGGDWRALGRKDDGPWSGRGTYGIVPWSGPLGTVTANGRPGAGAFSVADPRLNDHHNHTYHVGAWDKPAGTVTSGHAPSCGGASVSDPRLPAGRFNNLYRVVRWADPSVAVTGGGTPTSGGVCVADPRLEAAAGAGAGAAGAAGAAGVDGDVGRRRGAYPFNGAFAVQDPRFNFKGSYPDLFGVLRWDAPAKTISGKAGVSQSNCPAAVADPRFTFGDGAHRNKYRIDDWNAPAGTVISSTRPGSGAPCISDPRVACAPRAGVYGVAPWEAPAPTVVGSADVHQGAAAVADPRGVGADVGPRPGALPDDDERPDPPPIIVAEDGTWHRAVTTFELAAVQSLPVFLADGRPLVLHGKSHSAWRERIAEQMLLALLAAAAGATFTLGGTGVWVEPEGARL